VTSTNKLTSASIPTQRTATTTPTHPTIVVVVGTDMHRFDRLMGWLERWHTSRSSTALTMPRMVIQYGTSNAPAIDGAVGFLSHTALQDAMRQATLVVAHGGPATITEARRFGHLPIVVPRDPALSEHVDDHQVRFARRLAASNLVRLCDTAADLYAALDAGIADPARYALAADAAAVAARKAAVARAGALIDSLIASRR